MSKPKFPPEIKIHACEDFLSGKYTSAQVCEKYGITYNEKIPSNTVFLTPKFSEGGF